jgi:DNA-binding ferritin-like protein
VPAGNDDPAGAGETGDVATANLLEGFADGQEKTLWMLRTVLEPGK